MRDIKFRAWDKNRNEMRPVFSINNLHEKDDYEYKYIISNQKINGEGTIDWKDVELMQYTGLTDKNGKEIYEGDLLRLYPSDKTFQEIYWDNDIAGFNFKNRQLGLNFRKFTAENSEIVGNIFEKDNS